MVSLYHQESKRNISTFGTSKLFCWQVAPMRLHQVTKPQSQISIGWGQWPPQAWLWVGQNEAALMWYIVKPLQITKFACDRSAWKSPEFKDVWKRFRCHMVPVVKWWVVSELFSHAVAKHIAAARTAATACNRWTQHTTTWRLTSSFKPTQPTPLDVYMTISFATKSPLKHVTWHHYLVVPSLTSENKISV